MLLRRQRPVLRGRPKPRPLGVVDPFLGWAKRSGINCVWDFRLFQWGNRQAGHCKCAFRTLQSYAFRAVSKLTVRVTLALPFLRLTFYDFPMTKSGALTLDLSFDGALVSHAGSSAVTKVPLPGAVLIAA